MKQLLDVISGLAGLWPVWLFLAVYILAEHLLGYVLRDLIRDLWDRRRFARAGLEDIKYMSGRDFERYLERLFTGVGYRVQRTRYQGDYGVDLVLTAPDGKRIAVQAKRWGGKKVGLEAVQQVVAGAAHYGCDETIVVATSGYTEQARNLARSNNTRLLGLRDLERYMATVKNRQTAEPRRRERNKFCVNGQYFQLRRLTINVGNRQETGEGVG